MQGFLYAGLNLVEINPFTNLITHCIRDDSLCQWDWNVKICIICERLCSKNVGCATWRSRQVCDRKKYKIKNTAPPHLIYADTSVAWALGGVNHLQKHERYCGNLDMTHEDEK